MSKVGNIFLAVTAATGRKVPKVRGLTAGQALVLATLAVLLYVVLWVAWTATAALARWVF